MDKFTLEYLKTCSEQRAIELLAKVYEIDPTKRLSDILDSLANSNISRVVGAPCSCGSKNTIQREFQIRSSDEGASIVTICKDCGKTSWSS